MIHSISIYRLSKKGTLLANINEKFGNFEDVTGLGRALSMSREFRDYLSQCHISFFFYNLFISYF